MITISVVVLRLEAQGAYPMLLGRPWLRTTNIKQHWQRNIVKRQAQHRPDRLKKPRTESVGTDRWGQVCEPVRRPVRRKAGLV